MKDIRLNHFPADAAGVLDFLAKDFGLDGPLTSEEGYVGYATGRWEIWAILEERNRTVDTFVTYGVGEKLLNASVWELVRKAKLKGTGQPKTSAITRAGMQKSLAAQARALRLLLPLLFADEGVRLMDQ